MRAGRQANGRIIQRILGKSGPRHFLRQSGPGILGPDKLGSGKLGPGKLGPRNFFREFGPENHFNGKLGPEKFCAANI